MRRSLYFRPQWPTTLTLLLLCPLFVRAGVWQLDRAAQKAELAQRVERQQQLPPLAIDATLTTQALYRPGTARGTLESGDRILLENRKRDGRPGVHLIVPLRLPGSDVRLLIDRGWLAYDAPLPPADAEPTAGYQTRGLIAPPPVPPLRLGSDTLWGERWPYLDTERLAARHRYPVLPVVLIEDPRQAAEVVAALDRKEKSGMHTGYALQWFAFALIAVAGWLGLSLTREDRP